MVKKNKNRHCQESPTIQNGGDSAESGDQKKTRPNGSGCTHIQKAVQLAAIKKSLKNGCLASDCPGCMKDGVKPDGEECVPNAGLWLCLQCGHQGCGRAEKQHALKHYQVVHSDPHCIAVNTTSWNVWCYSCEVELASEYRKKLQECVKFLRNVDCPSSARHCAKACAAEGNKEGESAESTSMPLADVTNMPHGVRVPKKKMVSLPRVRGLHNLGNTCFLNSVLQCLAQTPHFLELLQETRQGGTRFCLAGGRGLLTKPDGKEEEEEDDEELPPLEGTLTKWGALTESLASTLEELRQDETTTVNPLRLFNKLIAKCPQFKGGDQHDAHELLRHLLDEVRTEDLKRYWVAILDQYGLSRHDTNETVASSVRAQVRAYGRQAGELWLLPDPVFRGILVSTVECQDCLHSYQRTEPFYELSLPVSTNKPQPPVMRRKAGGDDSFDVCGNVTNETPSKHQLKKERRQQRKVRKKYQPPSQKDSRTSEPSAGGAAAQDTNNAAESEQSDADVEDNVEQEVALKEAKPGERIVNGDISSMNLKLCNGNVSDNENIEVERTVKERSETSRRVDSEDLVQSDKTLCNGTRHGEGTDQENGSDAHSVDSQHVSREAKAIDNRERSIRANDMTESSECQEKVVVEEQLKSIKEFDMPLALPWKEVEVDRSEVKAEGTTGGNTLDQGNKLTNGTLDESEVIGNSGESEGNKRILENCVRERSSIGNETVEFMNTSNDSTCLHAKDTPGKDVPSEELSLSISVNSPSALGSPISQTGSPSSVSSDINVDLNVSNLVPSNSWPVEDTDRPFSRIAFCNDDDSLTLHNDSLQSSPPANAQRVTPKPASGEAVCLGLPTADQLAKEMVGLSIGHDERQSPSHWDTCSAHSLEDVKESKLGLSLEVPMCNGGSKTSDPGSLDDGDKSSTLAPRYHCGDKECSIESCLNQFTLLELMTGSCKVICERCSERINKGKEGKMVATNSTKQYLVSNPPAVLVLHLKRFEVHQNMFRKTPRHVTFPMLLDIAPICNTKCRELPTIRKGQTKVLYSLYGVVQHSGTLHGGHYSAYVKVRAPLKRDDMRWCFLPTAQSSEQLEELSKGASVPSEPLPGKWFHVSDSRVTEVNEDRVLHSQAYLLFYERVW